MELRQLEYFQMASRLRNITRAAERLRVSQPNITVAIKKLENELGIQLFDRSQKQLALTPEGAVFLNRIEQPYLSTVSFSRIGQPYLSTVSFSRIGQPYLSAVPFRHSAAPGGDALPEARLIHAFRCSFPIRVLYHFEAFCSILRTAHAALPLNEKLNPTPVLNLVFHKCSDPIYA